MFALHYLDRLRAQERPVGIESCSLAGSQQTKGHFSSLYNYKNWFLPITGMSLEKTQYPDENPAS